MSAAPLLTLSFQAREWLLPAAGLYALGMVAVVWSYARSPLSLPRRLACIALKGAGLLTLLVAFLEPAWTSERAKPGANRLAIVADNSASMQLQGDGEREPRSAVLRRVLADAENRWRAPLAGTFEVRSYLADTRLQPTDDFHELNFTGVASRLGETLQNLTATAGAQPLAGILLFSDGLATDLNLASFDTAKLPPVYPVIIGEKAPARDLSVAATTVSQTAFEDAPVTIEVNALAPGFKGEEIVARLSLLAGPEPSAKDQLIAEQTQKAPPTGQFGYRFQTRPERAGSLFYRLQLAPKTTGAAEATLANNETIISVERKRGPYRVLYVSGRPNWEYKFLRRAVEEDPETQLVALIRIAKREPKFEFKGRSGESSNPLFRGFGAQAPEEVERYDQPVLVTQNVRDENELRGGFPKVPEELFGYSAVILDDLEAEFFTHEQMSLLQRYVSERGGSLLMLGGMESFGEGNYQRTPIGDLLPIYLDRKADAAPPAGQLRWNFTREGWLQPWVRLRNSEGEERSRLEALPGFDILNAAGALKPAAALLATVSDGTREYPALATQRYGRGRAAAFLLGDFWKSGLGDEARQKDQAKAWRQTVRWLVGDVPELIELRAEPAPERHAVHLVVRARDAKYDPLENARVKLDVQAVGTAEAIPAVSMVAEPSATEAGVYEADYFPRVSGGYRVTATVEGEGAPLHAPLETGWSTDFAAAEYGNLAPNRTLMEELAKRTGGRVLTAEELPQFAKELPTRPAPVLEVTSWPLWHTPFYFLLALGCLVAEWGLRRRHGLP